MTQRAFWSLNRRDVVQTARLREHIDTISSYHPSTASIEVSLMEAHEDTRYDWTSSLTVLGMLEINLYSMSLPRAAAICLGHLCRKLLANIISRLRGQLLK